MLTRKASAPRESIFKIERDIYTDGKSLGVRGSALGVMGGVCRSKNSGPGSESSTMELFGRTTLEVAPNVVPNSDDVITSPTIGA